MVAWVFKASPYLSGRTTIQLGKERAVITIEKIPRWFAELDRHPKYHVSQAIGNSVCLTTQQSLTDTLPNQLIGMSDSQPNKSVALTVMVTNQSEVPSVSPSNQLVTSTGEQGGNSSGNQ
ncbi:hypothetical protein DPMN_178257 [Dreissena polymorpha]|uniref:Uncharacterized protein n=1 Tax=Dreissena polymorpha TaxID=45954 RepID=A0A9D4IL04_DREPO|nr:hypothetical protein DPMN_178257 [Dreissena polymorpha]